MESIELNFERYKILFFLKGSLLNISIKEKNGMEMNKIKFKPIQLRYEDKFKEHFSNFKNLISLLNDKALILTIKEDYFESSCSSINGKNNLKYLIIVIKNENDNKEIILKKIFPINLEYYLTKGPNNKRVNLLPFCSYIEKTDFDVEDVKELLDRENLLCKYNIDSYKYYNEEKEAFEEIKDKKIKIKDKIILEFHINGEKNYLINNMNLTQKYLEKEAIKIKNIINKLSDKVEKYDLIFLYASPIILNNGNYTESDSPISYMEEIRIILNLMKNKKNQFKCKFECINDKILKDVLSQNKTKILHISAHGQLENRYSLLLEQVKKNGQICKLNYDDLKYILNINSINISKLDLVFVSTCHSEDFGKLFIEYGAKHVIYIDKRTEINDKASVIFTEYFYDNLIKGFTIKDSYDNAIKKMKMKTNLEMTKINYKTCCCALYHESKCSWKEWHSLHKKTFYEKNEKEKLYKCTCEYFQPNYHDINNCEYYKKRFKDVINKGKVKYEEVDNNTIKICCCDLSIEHNEISKIKIKSKSDNLFRCFTFSFKWKRKIIY